MALTRVTSLFPSSLVITLVSRFDLLEQCPKGCIDPSYIVGGNIASDYVGKSATLAGISLCCYPSRDCYVMERTIISNSAQG